MDDTELKQLAEFAAEFSGLQIVNNIRGFFEWDRIKYRMSAFEIEYELTPHEIFDGSKFFAPILAHLAKRKMEGMGFDFLESLTCNVYSVGFYRLQSEISECEVTYENEFIALWKAIIKALKHEF